MAEETPETNIDAHSGHPRDVVNVQDKQAQSETDGSYAELWQKQVRLFNEAETKGKIVLVTSTDGRGGYPGVNAIQRDDDPKGVLDPHAKNAPGYLQDSAASLLSKERAGYGHERIADTLAKRGIFESIVVQPLQRDTYVTRQVEIKGTGGFFRKPKYREEKSITGREQILMRDISGTNGEEAACGIYYYISTTTEQTGDNGLPREFGYRDFANREGNYIDFKLFVPQSLAVEIVEAQREDPTFLRKLMEWQVMTNHYSPGFEQEWNQRARPKYNDWEKYVSPKILLVDRLRNPNAGTEPETVAGTGFNPANVLAFETKRIDVGKGKVVFGVPTAA